MTATVGALFQAAIARHPAQPLLTFYDDATGERVELSGITLANWVAKTANLLVDDVGLAPGESALVNLPPHWQSAAVLLGCWSAGIVVERRTGLTSFSGTPGHGGYLLGFAPMAMPMQHVPPGHLDYIAEVRGQGDTFTPYPPATPETPATPNWTQREICQRAAETAAAQGIEAGDRVLINGDVVTDPIEWLLAPLSVGASIVLCRHTDATKLDARRAAEKTTKG
jgi:uncharacterized protein (TIGR03089 family)